MKKGFTLIELLAVIVILAIIALIAVPIVLNIINDAERESELRSAELYIDAVDNSIMRYNLQNRLVNATCEVESNGNLDCGEIELTVDVQNTHATRGTITIENRRVSKVENLKVADNYYSTDVNGKLIVSTNDSQMGDENSQIFKPQYYGDWDFSGTVGNTNAPTNTSKIPPEGKNYYLGYDVSDGKVSAAYSCFKKDNTEYCLKGYDTSSDIFNKNTSVIRAAFDDVIDTCFYSETKSSCGTPGWGATVNSNGSVSYGYIRSSGHKDEGCAVYYSGSFGCYQE